MLSFYNLGLAFLDLNETLNKYFLILCRDESEAQKRK